MNAKCPRCERKAEVNDDMTGVKCPHCGYEAAFDAYLERMKERVSGIVSDFQESSDKG